MRALTIPLLLWLSSVSAAPIDPLGIALTVTAQSRSIQPGELLVLTMTSAVPLESMSVRAFDKPIPAYQVDARTWRALIGIDLGIGAGAQVAEAEGEAGSEKVRATYAFTVRPKQFRTRRLTVDPDFVTPPSAEEARIVREAAELDRILAGVSPARLWSGTFVAPVRAAPNSAFGSRSVYNGVARSPHGGADFPSATGTPVRAPGGGRVVLARNLYFTGNTIILDHGLGLFSMLAHLSTMRAHEGDSVAAGAVVGNVGATGRVTGPHLHWAIRLTGARVDPMSLLALLGAPPAAR